MDDVPVNTTADFDLTDSGHREDLGIADPGPTDTTCDEPGCIRRCISDYCDRHSNSIFGDPLSGFDPVDTGSPNLESAPSRRELQRQLDRLEGKLDALVAALNADEDDE